MGNEMSEQETFVVNRSNETLLVYITEEPIFEFCPPTVNLEPNGCNAVAISRGFHVEKNLVAVSPGGVLPFATSRNRSRLVTIRCCRHGQVYRGICFRYRMPTRYQQIIIGRNLSMTLRKEPYQGRTLQNHEDDDDYCYPNNLRQLMNGE